MAQQKTKAPVEIKTIKDNYDLYELDTNHAGKKAFFKDIMNELSRRDFGIMKIGVPMPEGAGAFFTDVSGVERICLPDSWELDGYKVKFKDDKAFAIFLHEACHFLHFVRDEGHCDTPFFEGAVVTADDVYASERCRRMAEFEAGYRSMFFNKLYKLIPGRTVLDLNLQNMFIYDAKLQSPEWKKAYNDKIAGMDAKAANKWIKSLMRKTKKFTEWADPKHEIAGVI